MYESRNGIVPGEWTDVTQKCFDDQLKETRKLCHTFNMAEPESYHQSEILQKLLGNLPEGLTILSPVYFDYGVNTSFGKNVFVNHGCYFMDGAPIIIKDNVFIGPFCGFYTVNHPLEIEPRNKGLEKALPIVVEEDCWIGANACLLSGITLKRGCVVAAGSIVTKSFPANSLIAGNPAKLIRTIEHFSQA